MFTIESYALAVVACVVAMVCWGSWQNTRNLAERVLGRPWRFELYYWDFISGLLLVALLCALTFGSMGSVGRSFPRDLCQASASSIALAMISGVIWNLGTLLLVAAIAIAGMSVAFPIGGGIGWLLGILVNYIAKPVGNSAYLFSGMAVVAVAIFLSMRSYRLLAKETAKPPLKGIVLSFAAGILIAFFYRFAGASMAGNFADPEPGKLTPYTALVFFALGAWLSTFFANPMFMRKPVQGAPVGFADYRSVPPVIHLIGLVGGGIWIGGMMVSLLASGKASFAISYGLSSASPVVAALWGVFVWKEFAAAPPVAHRLLGGMFACYLFGLVLIVVAGPS
ncbi:MAG: multidrug DMT transporter permease [Bryobacteraceae bacterium]|jgi:glucose uptake protein